jgi:hypothetical protein
MYKSRNALRISTLLLISLILSFSQQLADAAQVSQMTANGLNVRVFPIYSPDMNDEDDCTEGSISVSRTDGTAFSLKDTFNLRSSLIGKDGFINYVYHPQNGLRDENGISRSTDGKYALIYPYAKKLPKVMALNFAICTFDFIRKVEKMPRSIDVEIEYLRDLTIPISKFTFPVQILPRDSEAKLISDLRKECGQNLLRKKFTYNLTVEQSGSPRRSGDPIALSGTLFRHGFPSPNDEIALYLESETYKDSRTLVASTKSDSKGQFEFSFLISRKKNSITSQYVIVVQSRAEPIGPISGPFDEMAYQVTFLWEPTARYIQASTDWVPTHTELCKQQLNIYNSFASNQQIRIFEDDNNRLIWFTAKSLLFGFKNKKSFSSQGEWRLKSGGTCFVSGYTTRTGKAVNGYSRRCP